VCNTSANEIRYLFDCPQLIISDKW